MDIQRVKIADLKPHPDNYNLHSDSQIRELMKSLRKHKQFKNVIVSDGLILAGHGLIEAARRLGMEEVEAEVRNGLSDAEKAAILISDNATAFGSESDPRKLMTLLTKAGDVEIPGVTQDWLDDKQLDFDELKKNFKRDRDKDEKEAKKDEKWFYVEFQDNEPLYAAVLAILAPMLLEDKHQIDGKAFLEFLERV